MSPTRAQSVSEEALADWTTRARSVSEEALADWTTLVGRQSSIDGLRCTYPRAHALRGHAGESAVRTKGGHWGRSLNGFIPRAAHRLCLVRLQFGLSIFAWWPVLSAERTGRREEVKVK